MAWLWSDDLARLLIERDGIPPHRVADWLSGPTAHRTELGALEFARELLGDSPADTADGAAISAA
ncbi:MAG TPA: hypothetical protein VLG28_14960 [Acidimicrobiia bacterium]|jgi:hypothetical protein|nr:hypothetical protein [Acidimicrobiia bacterium]